MLYRVNMLCHLQFPLAKCEPPSTGNVVHVDFVEQTRYRLLASLSEVLTKGVWHE